MAQIVTITNPLTGQPAQVDQLDHTAQQIDDGIARALPGGAIDLALSTKVNPNLLDNWYFANPVNQRGQTEYTGPGMTVDRWKLEDITGRGVVLINDDGSITIKNPEGNTDNIWWTQYRETSFTGEQCTISVLATEASVGAVYTGTNNLGIMLRQGMTTLTGVPTGNMAARIVVSPGNAVTMRGIKLELGDTQTLAHQDSSGNWVLNEIPDYGEQLRRCQRYYIDGSGLKFYSVAKTVELGGTYKFMIPVTFPVTMRATPAVSVNVAWSYGDPTEVSASDVTKGSTTIIVAASSEKVVGVTVEITAIANL